MILINKELKMGTLYFVVNENLKKTIMKSGNLKRQLAGKKGRQVFNISFSEIILTLHNM